MDVVIDVAARALRVGDPLAALKRIALRDDAPALALRGIALAQLGELGEARVLLRKAARAFGTREPLARARCIAAEAEVALAARELGGGDRALDDAVDVFESKRDRSNAVHARLLRARRLLLLGRVSEAELESSALQLHGAPAMLRARAGLLEFEISLRQGRAGAAHFALERARRAARDARVPALSAEIERASQALRQPAARWIEAGVDRSIDLREVEALLVSRRLVVDSCRRTVHEDGEQLTFARRPILLAILRALAEAWPNEVARDELIRIAFGFLRANASHRARLRVEVGRLRRELGAMAEIRATKGGFVLSPRRAHGVAVLAPPVEGADAALIALLADGASWSTTALALALGASSRTVQRTLASLEAAGYVVGRGRGRARRWVAAPISGWTTAIWLPALPVVD
ncbi:DNA-binding protein [Vulgatibacter incomptus]|nr:DNA-binding protein [Vulgatibacter incomptus]